VDFLLSAQSEDDPVGVIVSEKRLIVECDGSDFHDRLLSSSLCAIDGGRCASNAGVRCIQIFRCRDLPGLLCRVGRAVQFLKDSLEQLIEFATKRTVCGKECLEDHKANGHRNLAFHYWRVALSFRTCEAMKQPRYEGRSAFQRPFHPARARIC
jgi:hypothetical protein